jgi:hypothetical protein
MIFCIEFILKEFRVRVKYTLDRLERIFIELKRFNKQIELELSSKDTSLYVTKKGGTKIIEFRRLMLQVQINNLFKSPELGLNPKDIAFHLALPARFTQLAYVDILDSGVDEQVDIINYRVLFKKAWNQKLEQKVVPSLRDIIDRLYFDKLLNPQPPAHE